MADNPLARFFSREAGQQRRRALNALDQRIGDALGYYLGPQLAPRVGQAANALAMFSPGMDVQEAVQASGEMMAPNRTPLDRAASGAALAGALGAMFMPGGVSSIRQGVEDVADAAVRAYDPNTTNAFTVWHGSPHDFDRFSLDKIGTGEGAQAYGHGLYFADERRVAENYRNNLTGNALGVPYVTDEARGWLESAGGDFKRAAAEARDYLREYGDMMSSEQSAELQEAIRLLDSERVSWGRLYEVSIDAEPEDFLDWDRPLSEQPEVLRRLGMSPRPEDEIHDEALRLMTEGNARNPNKMWFDYPELKARIEELQDELDRRAPNVSGQEFYRGGAEGDVSNILSQMGYGNPEAQTQALREAGIPGIRYLDAGSRGAGDGSRNYVVFSDQLLSILNKYGLAGGAALGAGALAMQPGEAQAMPPEASFLEKYLP